MNTQNINNSGNCNSGRCNSGNHNSGDYNSGSCNSGSWETCEGFLKTYEYKKAWANTWSSFSQQDKQKFLDLPNFDAAIFKEITGIDINNF